MLINTIAQLRAASSINVSNNIDNWLPYLEDAEEMFIIPVIGETLYDAIIAYLNPDSHQSSGSEIEGGGGGISTPDENIRRVPDEMDDATIAIFDELILKLRKALALYALYLGVDEMSVSISGAGIQVIQSDTHKPAPQYQVMNLKETYLSRAHRQVDLILKFIKNNITVFEPYSLPESPYFIRNAEEFQLYADIHGSRRVFLSLLPVIGSIEMKYIKPTLSPLLFDDLKAKFKADEITPDEQALVDLLLPALVHLTMARALMEISIEILDWGIFNSSANTFTNIQNKAQANRERIAMMYEANQRDGESELKLLQEFLDNHASADKYPLYYASSRFVGAENAVKRNEFLNSTDNAIFVA